MLFRSTELRAGNAGGGSQIEAIASADKAAVELNADRPHILLWCADLAARERDEPRLRALAEWPYAAAGRERARRQDPVGLAKLHILFAGRVR